MIGKTVLITGGNSGIGKATAISLAAQGARVVVGARPSAKTNGALEEIRAVAVEASPVLIPLEMASFDSIRACVGTFLATFSRLDVLINNAGVMPVRRRVTLDGFEATFGINYLGHFLLTALLQERLVASAPARIVHVSSVLHHVGRIDFESFRGQKHYRKFVAYAQSKLANLIFSNELARRLESSRITSNAVHPGAIRTDLMRDEPAVFRRFVRWTYKVPHKGASSVAYLATAPALSGTTGCYFSGCRPARMAARARDPLLATRLWDISEVLCSLHA